LKKIFPDTKKGVCLRGLAGILIILILCLAVGFIAGEIGNFILVGLSVLNTQQGNLSVLLFTLVGGILGIIGGWNSWKQLNVILKIRFRSIIFIALGSNQGDSQHIVLDAITRLQLFSELRIIKSSLWQTSPVNCPPESPKFVNAVVGLIPNEVETPESLLKRLRELEISFGRAPKMVLNEPRPLDLDLIVFGNEVRNSPELILPHPRAYLRKFVLQPLSEIAPELILPNQKKTVLQLLAEISSDEILTRL
jgi:2-amino-4-hydroxy-6-hydroxymethyldihydropteridine diphosphokinase